MAQKLKHLLFGHYGGNIPFNPNQSQSRRGRRSFRAVMLPQEPDGNAYLYQAGQQSYPFNCHFDVRFAKNKADKPYAVIRMSLSDFNRIVLKLPPISYVPGEIFEVRIACRADIKFPPARPFDADTLAINDVVIVFRKNYDGRVVRDATWELMTPVVIEIDPEKPV